MALAAWPTPSWRAMVARLGERGLATGGGLFLGMAFLGLRLAPAWPWALCACCLAGLGFYMLHNTLQTNATQMAPHARGTAMAVFASCFFLGQSAGVAAAAVIVDQSGSAWLFTIAAAGLPLTGMGFGYMMRYRARLESPGATAQPAGVAVQSGPQDHTGQEP